MLRNRGSTTGSSSSSSSSNENGVPSKSRSSSNSSSVHRSFSVGKGRYQSTKVFILVVLFMFVTAFYSLYMYLYFGMDNNNNNNTRLLFVDGKGTEQNNRSITDNGSVVVTGEKGNVRSGEGDDDDTDDIHIVFSTDCSGYQHWQSYLLFFSAYRIKQPGKITRIASGCSDESKRMEEAWHDEHVKKMSEDYNIHFTPQFSAVKDKHGNTKGDYKFFNKPMGLLHWLEHGNEQVINTSTGEIKNENALIALIDPDMIFLKHLTREFSGKKMVIRHAAESELKNFRVDHGVPFAQTYALGTQWRRFHLDIITSDVSSHAKTVGHYEAERHYAVGPPYLATIRDMYEIAKNWVKFVPMVHAEYPHLYAEMYAFCIAAAHLNLPHELVEHLVVSDSFIGGDGWPSGVAGGEGWPFIDNLLKNTGKENICGTMMNESIDYLHSPSSVVPLPTLIHFCQRYIVGEWFFGKRSVPKNIFTCDYPLLEVPPLDLDSYDYKVPVGKVKSREKVGKTTAKRDAFIICTVTRVMNEASMYFKRGCPKKGTIAVDKSMNMHRDLFG